MRQRDARSRRKAATAADRHPAGAGADNEHNLILDPRHPSGAREQTPPGTIGIESDVTVPATPHAGRASGDDIAGALDRGSRRRGQAPILDRKLHHPIEQAQRLIVGDVLLRLAGLDIGQEQVDRIGHGEPLRIEA